MAKKITAPARATSLLQAGLTNRDASIKKISKSARIADGVLMVGFAAVALYTGWWVWWACAAFSLVTIVLAPLERGMNFLSARLIKPARR